MNPLNTSPSSISDDNDFRSLDLSDNGPSDAPTPEPDVAAIRGHVNLIHQQAAMIEGDGKIVVASYGEDPKTGLSLHPIVRHFQIGDVEANVDAIILLSQDKHRNVYMPLAILKPDLSVGKKGGEEDVLAVIGLMADFDDDRAADYIDRLPVPSDFVIETSPGRYQAGIIFDCPIIPSGAKALAVSLKDHAKCDTCTGDISHVWRIPGTYNWPNKTKVEGGRSMEPQLVTVCEDWSENPTDTEDLKSAMNVWEPVNIVAEPVQVAPTDIDVDVIMGRFPDFLKDKIITAVPKGKRSDAIFNVCGLLIEKNLSDEEGAAIIDAHPDGIGEKFAGDENSNVRALKEMQRARENTDEGKGSTKLPVAPQRMDTGFTARDLMKMEFPDVRYIAEKIIPEGFTLLAGKPKLGKSWLAFQLAIAVADGSTVLGGLQCEKGGVLYLALEDNPRRLKKRLTKLLNGREAPKDLTIETDWPRLGTEGGEERLREWLKTHSNTALIIVDTVTLLRPIKTTGSRNIYQDDYSDIRPLQQLAAEHQIAVLGIHHLRKMESDDPLDMISGSTGMTGASDTIGILSRNRGQSDGKLYITGRDIEEEVDFALEFDHHTGEWTIIGNTEEHGQSDERKEVLNILRKATDDGSWLQPKQIANQLGIAGDYSSVRHLIKKLADTTSLVEHKTGKGYRLFRSSVDDNNELSAET